MNDVFVFLGKRKGHYFNKFPFLESFEIKKWFSILQVRSRGKKGFSIKRFRHYCDIMRHYVTFTKMSPESLIDEVEGDEKKGRREREFPASIKLKGFFEYLTSKGYAPKSAESYVGTVRGFYRHNGFKIDVYVPKQETIKPKIELTRDLVKRLLDVIHQLRDRVIVLIMCSSGMSIYDVLDLKFKHVNTSEIPILIKFSRVKNSQHYKTFLSSECSNVLQEYIRIYRKDIKNDDFLFMKDEKKLWYDPFRKVLIEASQKILGSTNLNTKSFRRFFSSQMKKAGMSSDIVNFMMGHSIGIEKEYLDSELRDVYKSKEFAVTINLTLNKDEIVLNKQTLDDINRKISEQRREINELKEIVFQLIDRKS